MNDWIVPPGINIQDYEAIVYVITSPSGRKYLGSKVLRFRRGKKWVESDWRTYYGSSLELSDEIAQSDPSLYRREIIYMVKDRRQTLYFEEKFQFQFDVLHATLPDGRRAWYNSTIGNRWRAPKGAFDDLKKQYSLKPLICRCSKPVPFSKRHTHSCSAKCFKQFYPESIDVKKQKASPGSRSKAGAGKIHRGASDCAAPGPV